METDLRIRIVSLFLLVFSAVPVFAANGICRGFNFQNNLSSLGLYEVTDTGRTRFIKGWTREGQHCPSLDPNCRQPSFLIEGDKVVVNEIDGDFACANYVNEKGVNIANWLPLGSLSRTNMDPKWRGGWKTYDGKARLSIENGQGGRLMISGSAEYDTGTTINTGEIAGEGNAMLSEISFGYDGSRVLGYEDAAANRDCAVRMRQLGPYIAVIDNGACGGLNVSFTGLYRRQ